MLPLISYVIAWSAFTVWKKAKNTFTAKIFRQINLQNYLSLKIKR